MKRENASTDGKKHAVKSVEEVKYVNIIGKSQNVEIVEANNTAHTVDINITVESVREVEYANTII